MKKIKYSCLILLLSIFILPIDSQTILLKNGEVFKGQISSQDSDLVVIRNANGSLKAIIKQKILKVIYKEVTEKDLERITKEEQEKLFLLNKEREDRAISEEKLRISNLESVKMIKAKETIAFNIFSPMGKNCKPFASTSNWYWLYGNYPFTKPDWAKLLPKDTSAIQIRPVSTWIDTFAAILIGSVTSITRRTTVIDVCELDSNLKITTIQEIEAEKNELKAELEFNQKLLKEAEVAEQDRIEKELKEYSTKSEKKQDVK